MAKIGLTKLSGAGLAADLAETTGEPTGFPTRADSILSLGTGSPPATRTVTIEPSGASGGSPPYFNYFIHGVEYREFGANSVTIPDISGNYFIYFDTDQLLHASSTFPPGLLTNVCYVAVIYWNSETQDVIYFGEERHGLTMDGATHLHLHQTFGTRYVSGLTVGGTYNPNSDGASGSPFGSPLGSPFISPTDEDVQISVTPGYIRDEDLAHLIVDTGTKTNIYDLEQELGPIARVPIFYRFGSSGIWRVKKNIGSPKDIFPCIYSDGIVFTGANGLPPFNEFSDSPSGWQLTEVDDGNYFLMHYLATNDIRYPFIGIQGAQQYTEKPSGQTEAAAEISIFDGQLPFQEFVLVSTLIFKVSTSFTNIPKIEGVKTVTGDDYVDWRNLEVFSSTTGGAGAHDHGNLGGLADDDHLQYTTNAYDTVTDGTTTVTASGRDNTIRYVGHNGINVEVTAGGGSPPARASVNFSGSLNGLSDVNIHTSSPSPINDNVLQYNSLTGVWENQKFFENRVVINSYDDLPTPSGSPLMHHMAADTDYFITGVGITTPYPFYCEGNFSMTGLWVQGTIQLIYTGTAPMFTQLGGGINTGFFFLSKLDFVAPFAPVFNLLNPGSPSTLSSTRLDGVIGFAVQSLGNIENYGIVWSDCAFFGLQGGLTLKQTYVPSIFSMRQINFEVGDQVTVIDLQDSVWTTFEMRDAVFNLASGATQATAMSGLPNSGNLLTGRFANVEDCEFGTGGSPVDIIPLENITKDDVRWIFTGNSNTEDTHRHSLSTLTNNVTVTPISAIGVLVPVEGTWVADTQSQFILGGLGSPNISQKSQVRYIGERPIDARMQFTLALTVTGGTRNLKMAIFINGVQTGGGINVPNVSAGGTGQKIASIPWFAHLEYNDVIEVYVANLSSTDDILALDGSILIGQ